jgi:hypothetical protein
MAAFRAPVYHVTVLLLSEYPAWWKSLKISGGFWRGELAKMFGFRPVWLGSLRRADAPFMPNV